MLGFTTPTTGTLKFLNELGAGKIVFCNLDAVLGKIFTGQIGQQFGKIDIVHSLREGREDWRDFEFLRDSHGVISTCWDKDRTLAAVADYEKRFSKKPGYVRVYDLGVRLR